jgi:hypothetical protein
MVELEHDQLVAKRGVLVKKLEAVVCGVFLIWIGIAFLAHVGWGAGLLGVGAIALGAQLARKYLGVPADRFGLAVGIIFAVWGVWMLLRIRLDATPIAVSPFPIVFIVAGIVLFVSALRRKRPQ